MAAVAAISLFRAIGVAGRWQDGAPDAPCQYGDTVSVRSYADGRGIRLAAAQAAWRLLVWGRSVRKVLFADALGHAGLAVIEHAGELVKRHLLTPSRPLRALCADYKGR